MLQKPGEDDVGKCKAGDVAEEQTILRGIFKAFDCSALLMRPIMRELGDCDH
jgi:hypothetical protein